MRAIYQQNNEHRREFARHSNHDDLSPDRVKPRMLRMFHWLPDFVPHRFSFLLLVAACLLLSGCASDQPKLTIPSVKPHRSYRQHYDYRHSRAYNRPYRVKGRMYYPLTSPEGYNEIGMASWYGHESGSRTSMGTRFNPEGISAAHKTLPLPSRVRVTNLHNGRSVELVVNDRGPFKANRIIDLSRGAARRIGVNGLAKVKVVYLGRAY